MLPTYKAPLALSGSGAAARYGGCAAAGVAGGLAGGVSRLTKFRRLSNGSGRALCTLPFLPFPSLSFPSLNRTIAHYLQPSAPRLAPHATRPLFHHSHFSAITPSSPHTFCPLRVCLPLPVCLSSPSSGALSYPGGALPTRPLIFLIRWSYGRGLH